MNPAPGTVAEPQPATPQEASLPTARAAGEGPAPEEIQVPVLENVDRAVTGLITLVPPLLLVLAGWQLWNHELHWRDIVDLPRPVHPDRAGGHRRLPSPAHTPQLQDLAAAAGRDGGAGHDGRRGAGDLMGGRPSQAPRLLRPLRRSAQPPRRSRGRPCRAALRGRCGWATRTWAGCSTTPSAAPASASRPTCSPTRSWRSSTGRSCCGRWSGWRSRSRSGC